MLVGGCDQLLLPLESLVKFLSFRLLTSLDLAHHLLNQVDLLVLLEYAHPLDNMLRSTLYTAGPTLLLGWVLNSLVRLFRLGREWGVAGQYYSPLSLVSVVQNLPLMLLDFFLYLSNLLIYYGERVLLDSL